MKFFIKTFGCQMNVNDSEKMRFMLEQKGLKRVATEKEAEIIIINSCAVREKSQEKIFSYIGRQPKEKKIIVSGCVAQSEKKDLMKRSPNINFIIGTHQFYKIGEILDEIGEKNKKGVVTRFSRQWEEVIPDMYSRESKNSGYISIMEGCNNFCSYCIVPFTRGREKNRPFENILKEAEFLAREGYSEIILLGQNVNNWQDDKAQVTFPDLLARIAARIDVRWIRFITSYPGYYEKELITVMKHNSRIARHIHFPAQSGSTRILKKMNRTYSRDKYLKIINDFKKNIPGICFSSDFIVGFPDETENDFSLTLSLMEEVEFESVFSFIYSPRKHTRAADLQDNVNPEIKKQRLYQLQDLQNRIQLKNNKKKIGQVIEVLVTQPHPRKQGEVIGRTESYRVVNFVSRARPGEFRKVKVEKVGPHSLGGRETD